MKINIKSISNEEKLSKNNKTYTSCKITVWSSKENKDIILSGFGDAITKTWNAGDEVDVTLLQTEQGYWNFELNENSRPSKTAIDYLKEISEKLSILVGNDLVKSAEQIGGKVIEPGDPDYVKPEDINF